MIQSIGGTHLVLQFGYTAAALKTGKDRFLKYVLPKLGWLKFEGYLQDIYSSLNSLHLLIAATMHACKSEFM